MITVITGAAVAFFQSTRIERFVTRNYADLARAQLAADAGLAAASSLLRLSTTNDHFIIVLNPTNRQLYAGNGSNQPAGTFAYQPLWSCADNLTSLVVASITNGLPAYSNAATTNTNLVVSLPGGSTVTSPSVAWVNLTNAAGQTNARFAFWMDDLAGRLDLSISGDIGTNAARPTGTNPAELAVWWLFNSTTNLDTNNPTVSILIANRAALVTPASARLVSTNFTTNLMTDLAVGLIHDTNEPDLVPYGFGYANQGQPKMNLNQAITNANALNLIAGQITNNLPNFSTRAGGMNGSAYIYALAANIIDYADANDDATTTTTNGIRIQGFDNYPYLTHLFDSITYQSNNPTLTITTYLQFWNLSSRTTTNTATFNYSFNDTIWYPTNILSPTNSIVTNRITTAAFSANISLPAIPPNSGFIASVTNIVNLTNLPNFPNPGWSNIWLNVAPVWNPQPTDQRTQTNFFNLQIGGFSYSNAIGMARVDRSLNSGSTANMGSIFGLRTNFAGVLTNPVDPRTLPFLGAGSTRSFDDASYPATIWKSYPAATNVDHSGNPALWLEGKGSAFASNGPSAVTNPAVTTLPGAFSIFPNSPPALLSPANQYLSVTELGRVFDPIQWRPANLTTNDFSNLNITTAWVADNFYGGGSTLRIGRPEHSRFTNDGTRAAQLLDLFSAGPRTNNNGTNVLNSVAGRINLNTATTNTLLVLAAGVLHTNDPEMTVGGSTTNNFVFPTNAINSFVRAVTNSLTNRPFFSPAQLGSITRGNAAWPGNAIFGNGTNAQTMGTTVAWNDAAAEEWFSKIFPLCTVRSRNFMIYVVAQAMATNSGRPIASAVRAYQVYAEPLRNTTNGLTTNVNILTLRSWSP